MDGERIGPYLIETQIGSGGMGTVYRARHSDTGDQVALKVLPPALAHQEGFVERFQREVEALRQLHNPHIVRFLDSGSDRDTYYLAMEYVSGENLAQRLGRVRRLPWQEAVQIGLQLCTALKAAHDAGVIHRDLKPSNVLLTPEGHVKLTDFGVAQLFSSERLTISGGVIGTAEYMSPEQAQGRRATNRSDLYALGAVLYALLTGRPPFTGATSVEILQKHCFGQFDRPRRCVVEIPARLDDLIAELLEKNPQKRPPDAGIVARRLRSVLQRTLVQPAEDSPAPDSENALSDRPTAPAPGQATILRNFIRDEIRRDEPQTWWQKLWDNTAVLLTLLIGLILLVWWLETRRLTPEEHLARARAILAEPPSSAWFEARDQHLQPLLDADPQRWSDQVQPLLEEIALYELEQRITAPRRRLRKSPLVPEPERLLTEVRRLWEEGRFGEAEHRLQIVQRLLAADPQAEDYRKLAARWQASLAEISAEQTSSIEYVRQMLAQARTLAEKQPQQARELWQAIVELYGNDPRLDTEIAEARRQLEQARSELAPY